MDLDSTKSPYSADEMLRFSSSLPAWVTMVWVLNKLAEKIRWSEAKRNSEESKTRLIAVWLERHAQRAQWHGARYVYTHTLSGSSWAAAMS
jgi:hypothetical protein